MSRHRIDNRAKAKRARTGGRRGRLTDVGAQMSRVSMWLGTGAVTFGVGASVVGPTALAYAAPLPPTHSDSAGAGHPDGVGTAGSRHRDGDSAGAGSHHRDGAGTAGTHGTPGSRHRDGAGTSGSL